MASNDTAAEQKQCGDESAAKDTSGTTPVFPLFDLKKRKETIMQQKRASSRPKKVRGAAQVTTPISLSDTENVELETATTTTAKSTKPRKPRSKPTTDKGGPKPKRRNKEDPDGEFSGTGTSRSTKNNSASIAETRASTTPTLLTPMSSPLHEGGAADGGDLVDPNQGRRKRRKKTPIGPQITGSEEDSGADFLPPHLAQEEFPISDIDDPGGVQNPGVRPLAIRECPEPKLLVEVPVRQTGELPPGPPKPNAFGLLMKKKKCEAVVAEDEPELPPHLSGPLDEAVRGSRTPVSFDSNTGILTIRSSPVLLPSLAPPSMLNPLGKKKRERKKRKKKDEDIPELSLSELPLSGISGKTVSKNTTTEFDHETGIFTFRSSPMLAPQSPKLRPNAFSILGKKKEIHPLPAQPQAPPHPSRQTLSPTITVHQALIKVAPDKSKKNVHPFFQPGGLKKVPGVTHPSTTEAQSDMEGLSFISSRTSAQPKGPLFGSNLSTGNAESWLGSGGGRLGFALSHQILRSPGLADAPWPSKYNCHARGLPTSILPLPSADTGQELFKTERKLKDRVVTISHDEDLLLQYSHKLPIQRQKQEILAPDYNVTRYYNTPSDVRLPERIVTTGSKLQEMVQKQVSARLPHPNVASRRAQPMSDSDGESGRPARKKVHPALLKLYNRIRNELSPFDKGECEQSSWGVKYAPESSQEVMQVGKETLILKEWLMALKVESVGVSSDRTSGKRKSRNSTPTGAGGKGGVAKKKRKKKKDDELAGFIINSDEERDEMDEITDPENNDWASAPSGIKRSTIRAGDRGIESPFGGLKELARLVNAVVISGPNGCGKTAAVYAVAKEAGFTVFEVSPGMRRSGKDILDQVGEMSRTHLVHQTKTTSERATSFFKPKTKIVQKLKTEEDPLPKLVPGQQQSLILLEEVDLLFEEDKQFWSTVLALMAQSKRPIILTCNDESLLPLDTLPLHAILRFTPPPRELVVDQLLLICANEGHLLQRDAVESLVKSHNGDIRASLVELEFWCRMGLGDRKGGMDWMIIRWPMGVDIADNGETLRVVSKDTYIKGMGFTDRASKEEDDQWRSVWETWEVDVGGEDDLGMLKLCAGATRREQMARMASLKICDEYAEAMSAVDCYAGGSMRGFDESILDITQPRLGCKVRVDDMQGYPILQTDPMIKMYSVGVEMATSVRSLARRYLCTTKCHRFTEEELADRIAERSRIKQEFKPLSQNYLSETFRPLSYASTLFALTPAVCHSSVNGPPSVLMIDVAPYVREIVRHDVKREQERMKSGSLLSAGGGGKKRNKRATNASRVAEEGGNRRRKERWFADVNATLVEGSGGKWSRLSEKGGGIGIEMDEDGNVQGGMGSDEDGEYELESEQE